MRMYGNPPKPYLDKRYFDQTAEEKLEHYHQLGRRILRLKCLYYLFATSAVSDYEYDWIERYYEAVAEDVGQPPAASDQVGFSRETPLGQEVYQECVKEMGHEASQNGTVPTRDQNPLP